MDFFKYAQGGSGKRKLDDAIGSGGQPDVKKRKAKGESEDEDSGSEVDKDEEAEDPLQPPVTSKHRVTAKGKNVPGHIDTFLTLKDRYDIPSLILSNLSKNGYNEPTGIQSYGIPILLEVRQHNC